VTSAPPLDGLRAVELVLATAGPVSLDQLVAWNVARPTDLWRWLEGASGQRSSG